MQSIAAPGSTGRSGAPGRSPPATVAAPCSYPSSPIPRACSSGPWSSGQPSASPAGTWAAPTSATASASPARERASSSASRASGPAPSSGSTSTSPSPWASSPPSGRRVAPHPWWRWSILGSALILFVTYFQVQVSVAINDWYGPFYDLIQAALGKTREVTIGEFYRGLATFLEIALRRRRRRRAVALLHQPLRLPLADGDERLLHVALAAAAQHRGRLAARAGRHHALRQHDRVPRRQPHRRDHDADRLPAGAWCASPPTSPRCRSSAPSPTRWWWPPSSGRRSAPPSSRSSASSFPASSSATSASRPPTARSWSTARTTPTAPTRPRCASSSPTCGGTISASTSTTCTSTSPASSTCRSTTSSAT